MELDTGCVAAMDDISFENLQCNGCQATFSSVMEKLQHTCTREYFDCKICNQVFPDALSLSLHPCSSGMGDTMSILHPDDAMTLSQPGDTFSQLDDTELDEGSQQAPKKKTVNKKKQGKSYECEVCHLIVIGAKNLTKHARQHPGYKAFKCDMCERAFTQGNHLLEHRKRHQSKTYYPCNKCDRSFQSYALLLQHGSIHTVKHPFKCKKCGKGFSCHSSLYRHNQTHIIGPVPNAYSCDICDETFTSPALLAEHDLTHQTGHVAPAFPCKKCSMSFHSKSSLYRHNLRHPHEVSKTFCCNVCGETFSSSSSLSEHELTHQKAPVSGAPVPGAFKCKHCSMAFNSKSSLYRHNLTHFVDNAAEEHCCAICGEAFSSPDLLTQHVLIHQSDLELGDDASQLQLNCAKCGEVFGSHLELRQHACTVVQCTKCKTYVYDLEQHTCNLMVRHKRAYRKRAKDQMCKICGKIYSSFKNFNKHCLSHGDCQQYECNLCGHKFIEKKYLVRHERLHDANKPYGCDLCGMKFRYRIALAKHSKTYDEELPFKCEVCGIRFSSKCKQYSHFNEKHDGEDKEAILPDSNKGSSDVPVTEPVTVVNEIIPSQASEKANVFNYEKKLVCRECGGHFSGGRALQRHMDFIHNGKRTYRCNQCEASFSCSTNLKKHVRVHNGLGPLKCNICNAGFYQWPQLKSHRLIHRGNKLLSCESCNAKFTTSYSFNHHPCQKKNVNPVKTKSEVLVTSKPPEPESSDTDEEYKAAILNTDPSSSIMPKSDPNTDCPLAGQILKVLTMVVDKPLLGYLGWPEVPVDQLLQSVVTICRIPGQVSSMSVNNYVDKLRENCKFLLEVAVGKVAVDKLLQSKSVDAVMKILSET